MRIGFTGTQRGMSDRQKGYLYVELQALFVEGAEFHHGDCIGADAEAAAIAQKVGYRIVAHPPTNESKRAFFPSDEFHAALPYLERNHKIVDAVERMYATPAEHNEQIRSGTWATIRYARKSGKDLTVLYP